MHDIDTFMFFKWFFKAWVAVYLVTHTFTITMAVFDMAQHVVSGAAGVIGGNTNIDVDAALSSMQAGLDAMEIRDDREEGETPSENYQRSIADIGTSAATIRISVQ